MQSAEKASMGQPYIFFYDGYPTLVEELSFRQLYRMDVIRREWEKWEAVDDEHHYQIALDTAPPTYSATHKFFSHVLFLAGINPAVNLNAHWEIVGPYSHDLVLSLVNRGLETDDDIIQQWFGADNVLELLAAARDFSEVILAIQCIQGAFEDEDHPDAIEYVRRVLGDQY